MGWVPCRTLKRSKWAFLKSRVVIWLIASLPPCRTLNCTISWSLHPRLPPGFTSPTSPSLFVSNSNIPLLTASSTTFVRMLSSVFSRNLLGYVCLAVLSFQQISLDEYLMVTRMCHYLSTIKYNIRCGSSTFRQQKIQKANKYLAK